MSPEVVNGVGGDLKKKNREEEDMVQQLPYLCEDIITQILLKIPAESLFNTLRYVCKSWLNKISTHPDIHLNRLLPSKPPCLIIQNADKENKRTTCFFTLTKELGMIEEQFDDLNPIFENLWILDCCNGLILASNYPSKPEEICIVNPLTNHRVILPSTKHTHAITIRESCFKFVFIPSTGEYKVIFPGYFLQTRFAPGKHFIWILTLSAVDCSGSSSSSSSNDRLLQWRIILAPEATFEPSIAINGIIYWEDNTINGNGKETRIVSFDATVEKFYVTTCLHCDNNKIASRGVLLGLKEMGGLPCSWSLLLEEHDDVRRFRVRVVKDDFHEGEWINNYNIRIDTDFMKHTERDHPILSFGNGEVLIFHNFKENTIWAFNVKLNQWCKVGNKNLKEKLRCCFHGFHVNSKPVSLFTIE